MSLGAKAASSVLRAAWRPATQAATRLAETVDKEIVADVFSCAMKKQTGVSLKYMLTFGHVPLERQVSCRWSWLWKIGSTKDRRRRGALKRFHFAASVDFRRRPRRSPPSPSRPSFPRTLPYPLLLHNTTIAPPLGTVPPQRAPRPPRPPRRRARELTLWFVRKGACPQSPRLVCQLVLRPPEVPQG